jgi:hypothetical protein
VIDIEVMRLSALEEHDFARIQRVVQNSAHIGNVRPDALSMGLQVLGDLDWVDSTPVVDLHKHVVLLLESSLHFLAQDRRIEKILNPDTDPVDLV